MFAMNCQKAVNRIRTRISDPDGESVPADVVLEAINDMLQPVWTDVLSSGMQHEMDQFTPTFNQIETGITEAILPEYVGEIRLVMGFRGAGTPGVIIPKANTREIEVGRGTFATSNPVWTFSKFSSPGRIQIRGRYSQFTSYQIWYARKWAPLHYGQASATSAADGTTLALDEPATATAGEVLERDDLYIGMQVEITADGTNADNVGQLRRIVGYDGATRVATLETALPSVTTDDSTQYALVIPLDPDGTKYLIESAVYELYLQIGSPEDIAVMERRFQALQSRFKSNMVRRQNYENPRLHSSRRLRG